LDEIAAKEGVETIALWEAASAEWLADCNKELREEHNKKMREDGAGKQSV